MTRIFWCGLGVAYIMFLAWHVPLRGPLTDQEIADYTAQLQQSAGMDWAKAEAFQRFLETDDGRPFYMVNVIALHDDAQYPDGQFPEIQSAAEADRLYGTGVVRLLLASGSYPVFSGQRHATILNSYDARLEQFDTVALVRYRSRRDLMDMITSPAFARIEVHKWASVQDTFVAPSRLSLLFPVAWIVPSILVALGGAVALIQSRKRASGSGPDRPFALGPDPRL